MIRIPNLDPKDVKGPVFQVTIRVHEALFSSIRPGQSAQIRLDAHPDLVLHGHVKSVANVDSKQDWMAADVKVYQTIVTIDEDEPIEGFKPGNSAEVSILIDRLKKPGPLIPVQAIVEASEKGQKPTCFVKNEDGEPEERVITVGLSNETMAQIKSGLKEGDQVLMNPGKFLKKNKKARSKRGKQGKPEDNPGGFRPAQKVNPKDNGKPGGPPQGAPGGPKQGVPGQGKPGAGRPGGTMNPEQIKQRIQQQVELFKKLPPAKRKEKLQQMPEQWREGFKGILKQNGVEVPD
jgi:hypothetical protein